MIFNQGIEKKTTFLEFIFVTTEILRAIRFKASKIHTRLVKVPPNCLPAIEAHSTSFVSDKMQENETHPIKPAQPAGQDLPQQTTLNSTELLKGSKEVLIKHGEEIYRLRLTRNGKLILHK